MEERFPVTIRGGTIVTATGVLRCDLAIGSDGRIAAIEPSIPAGEEDIVADGLYVLPGGVDSHCHIEQKTSTGLTPFDDFFSAGVGALAGGTTTLIPFACQQRGERISEVVAAYRQNAEKSAADFALHIIVTDPAEEHAADDLQHLFAEGYSSVKVYMTYDALRLQDDQLLDVLLLCRQHGAMVMVHAESHDLIAWMTRKLLSTERIGAKFHAIARSAIAEREATHRAITFAELVGTPLLVVHVSSSQAAAEITRARARGLPIFGETCPQYLELTQRCLCRPNEEGKKYLCSPPLRTEADQSALWGALSRGDLQVVSSDHSAYNFGGSAPSSKTHGGRSTPFAKVPMGLPGLETRMPLLISGALSGKLCCSEFEDTSSIDVDVDALQRAVAVGCTNPAKLYGLFPRKGTLAVGSDGDVVLFDAHATWTVTKDALHDDLDYTPFEGKQLRGLVVRTLLRGKTVFVRSVEGTVAPRDGAIAPVRGGGEFVSCGRPELLGWNPEGAREWPDASDFVAQRCVEVLGPNLDGNLVCMPVSGGGSSAGRKRERDTVDKS